MRLSEDRAQAQMSPVAMAAHRRCRLGACRLPIRADSKAGTLSPQASPCRDYLDPCRATHAQRASRSDRLVTPSYQFRHGGALHFLSEEENITVALGLTEL